ncbi:hypothetical protein C2E23DRAFT_848893 [Lenzites betulinus]|nr:hypothetical protein C2E23DRAFT_848893 [Lenzites betulinus]
MTSHQAPTDASCTRQSRHAAGGTHISNTRPPPTQFRVRVHVRPSGRDRLRLRVHISLLSGTNSYLYQSLSSHTTPSAVHEARPHIGLHWYVVSAAPERRFPPASDLPSLLPPTANGTSVCIVNLLLLLPSASPTLLTDRYYDICPVCTGLSIPQAPAFIPSGLQCSCTACSLLRCAIVDLLGFEIHPMHTALTVHGSRPRVRSPHARWAEFRAWSREVLTYCAVAYGRLWRPSRTRGGQEGCQTHLR